MKVLVLVHGYPPELAGGTEASVRRLARALAARGDEVVVVAGSLVTAAEAGGTRTEATDGPVRVVRLHRSDLYFDHWHKSRSPEIAREVAALAREVRPDVAHVHHWMRLTRDLAPALAREGVPAVACLHDAWTSCPLTFRVLPETGENCDKVAGVHPCVACAGKVPPRTPWVPVEAGFLAFAERQQAVARELELARAVVVPTAGHGSNLEHFLGLGAGALGAEVVAPLGVALEPPRDPLAPPGAAGRLVVATWGALVRTKGADLVLDALERARHRDRIELVIAGSAPDPAFAAEIEARARDLGATVHGAFEPERLPEHPVARAHVLASGSRARESYSLVLDEALRMGIPAVAPDRGAFAARGGAAVARYEPGDAGALAAVLDGLLDDPERWSRLRAAALDERERLPDADAIVARWRALSERAAAMGAPEVPAEEWFEERMASEAIRAWDEGVSRTPPDELGFAP